MSEDWTEKYRPKTLKDVIGNPSAINELLSWARSWDSGIPPKRAAVLIGTPGVGKTTSAIALASDMGWGVVEMNASDQRTGDAIKDIALRGSISNTFDDDGAYLDTRKGGRKLIILDEADNLFGNADRGAMPVINELIKTTRQPVVLIVNDFYALSRKSSAVKNDTVQITFRKPTSRSIASALAIIAKTEGVSVNPVVLSKIADNAAGDMRAAVRDLESLATGSEHVDAEMADNLTERVVKKDMYAVVDAVFRRNNPSEARNMLSKVDTDPETALLWMDENLPYEYRDVGDLVRGYEKLSRADIYLGRVHRRQYYRFWAYANDMMTMGVATARMSSLVSRERIKFPTYLTKMSRSKTVRSMKASVCYKLAVLNHTSTRRVEYDILPAVSEIARNSPEFSARLVTAAGLEPEELGYIMGVKMDSPAVKAAFAAAAKPAEQPSKAEEPVPEPRAPVAKAAEPEPEPELPVTVKQIPKAPEAPPDKKQRNLFDF